MIDELKDIREHFAAIQAVAYIDSGDVGHDAAELHRKLDRIYDMAGAEADALIKSAKGWKMPGFS